MLSAICLSVSYLHCPLQSTPIPTAGCQNDFSLQTPAYMCICTSALHRLCQDSALILLKLCARPVTEGSLTQEIMVYCF